MNQESTETTRNGLPKWKPGESGNPAGRPKGSKNRSTIVKEILALPHEDGKNYEYAATKAIAEKAIAGDVMAWDKLMDAAHGKVADKTEITGEDGGPINIHNNDAEILARYYASQGKKLTKKE